jgi:hypothetical protein
LQGGLIILARGIDNNCNGTLFEQVSICENMTMASGAWLEKILNAFENNLGKFYSLIMRNCTLFVYLRIKSIFKKKFYAFALAFYTCVLHLRCYNIDYGSTLHSAVSLQQQKIRINNAFIVNNTFGDLNNFQRD